MVEHGVWGRETAPICRDIMLEYFRLHENRDSKTADNRADAIDIIW